MKNRITKLLGDLPFELADDGSLISCNCRGYIMSVGCDECNQDIDFILWVIIDGEKRADLLKQIMVGILHDPVCPHCQYKNHIDSDLLLFRRNEDPALLFSPTPDASAAEQMKVGRSFLLKLKQQLGQEWKDEWYEKDGKRGMLIVDRPALPIALSLGRKFFSGTA